MINADYFTRVCVASGVQTAGAAKTLFASALATMDINQLYDRIKAQDFSMDVMESFAGSRL